MSSALCPADKILSKMGQGKDLGDIVCWIFLLIDHVADEFCFDGSMANICRYIWASFGVLGPKIKGSRSYQNRSWLKKVPRDSHD